MVIRGGHRPGLLGEDKKENNHELQIQGNGGGTFLVGTMASKTNTFVLYFLTVLSFLVHNQAATFLLSPTSTTRSLSVSVDIQGLPQSTSGVYNRCTGC